MRKARHRRTHIEWFHLSKVQKRAKLSGLLRDVHIDVKIVKKIKAMIASKKKKKICLMVTSRGDGVGYGREGILWGLLGSSKCFIF